MLRVKKSFTHNCNTDVAEVAMASLEQATTRQLLGETSPVALFMNVSWPEVSNVVARDEFGAADEFLLSGFKCARLDVRQPFDHLRIDVTRERIMEFDPRIFLTVRF